MNDPNGPIQWRGRYHLFYQHNPDVAVWGNLHWGHAVSDDLVRWRHMPIALGIPDDDLHRHGVWSGCCVADDDGSAAILYSTHDPSTVCLARSRDDDLRTWTRHADNPVIPALPGAAGPNDIFRDPYCWREKGEWRMAVGAGLWESNGASLLFRSHDLRKWEYLGRLAEGPEEEGTTEWRGVWECPLFWKFDDAYVLIVSSLDIRSDPLRTRVLAMSGSYNGIRFEARTRQRLDYGDAFYAPNVLHTEDGRHIVWAWLRECRSGGLDRQSVWSGCLTLPRVLHLDRQGHVVMAPAPEVRGLRTSTETWEPEGDDLAAWLRARAGVSLEIALTWRSTGSGRRGVAVCAAEDGTEETRIVYDPERSLLLVERSESRAGGASVVRCETLSAPLTPTRDSPLELRIFLDHSVLEVFTGTTACISTRVYPAHASSRSLRLIGGGEEVVAASVHQMAAI
jgi:beta-fructofuranosidase